MLEKIKSLQYPLPEEIQKEKDYGNFDQAIKLINQKLEDESVPSFIKTRLELEKEILERLPLDYPFNEKEALKLVQEEIPDFTMDELHAWQECGGADWIYVNGEKHLLDRFFGSMKKVYKEIADRANVPYYDKDVLYDNIAYMKENGQARWRIHLKSSIRIKDEDFKEGKVLVHLPIPAECLNMENIEIISVSDPCAKIDAIDSLSRTVSFAKELKENETFTIAYAFDSVVKYTAFDDRETYIDIDTDLAEEAPHIIFTPTIKQLVDDVVGNEVDPLKKARKIYDFITKNVIYSFMREYITLGNIPEYCITRLKGDCGVQALLFVTMCRYAGIPARWQSGKFVSPNEYGNHDWAMFYVSPYGWLFADCSFGGAAYRAGKKEGHDFYFGNLDPFRMAANNAFQQEFNPPKKHWRIDPYDNQKGEIEYEDYGLRNHQVEANLEVVEIKQIEG